MILFFFSFSCFIAAPGCGGDNTRSSSIPDGTDGDSDSDSDSDSDADSGNGVYLSFHDEWFGYAWPEVVGPELDEMTPADYSDLVEGDPLCAAGKLAKDGIGSYAMIAFTVEQEEGASPEAVSLKVKICTRKKMAKFASIRENHTYTLKIRLWLIWSQTTCGIPLVGNNV